MYNFLSIKYTLIIDIGLVTNTAIVNQVLTKIKPPKSTHCTSILNGTLFTNKLATTTKQIVFVYANIKQEINNGVPSLRELKCN